MTILPPYLPQEQPSPGTSHNMPFTGDEFTTAPLQIRLGVFVKNRDLIGQWKTTTNSTDTWVVNTTILNYQSDLATPLQQIWTYTLQQRNSNVISNILDYEGNIPVMKFGIPTGTVHAPEVGVHITGRLENVTAARPPTGAWVQAKQNFDAALADGDFNSISDLQSRIDMMVSDIQTKASRLAPLFGQKP